MAAKAEQMMATVLAHEIKNPTAIAMAYASLIRQFSDDAEIIEYCNHIHEALVNINELVQELLLNKVEPIHDNLTPLNITEMLAEMLDEYRAAMPGISLSMLADADFTLHTNEQHIRLVFSNLLKNAVEAAGDKGYVIVYVEKADCSKKYLQVKICNSCESSKVSQPKPHGTGLGLSICYWLLEQLGGELKIEMDAGKECTAIVSILDGQIGYLQDKVYV